jgi:hypothetical protein
VDNRNLGPQWNGMLAHVHDAAETAQNHSEMRKAIGKYPISWELPKEEGITYEHLDPSSLAHTQSYIVKDQHDSLREGYQGDVPIHVVRAQGKNYVEDGTHRSHWAAEQGKPVLAAVKDLSKGRF